MSSGSQSIQLRFGDCVEVIQGMAENSVQSVVTDPPYGIGFGGAWDRSLEWDWHRDWLMEVFRVLTSGGRLKAFSGTRTYHRLARLMVEVGFQEIQLEAWCYSSGFPKNLDLSKAIDAQIAFGSSRPQDMSDLAAKGICTVIKERPGYSYEGTMFESPGRKQTRSRPTVQTVAPASDAAKRWCGYGTALKPAWEPFLVGVKP